MFLLTLLFYCLFSLIFCNIFYWYVLILGYFFNKGLESFIMLVRFFVEWLFEFISMIPTFLLLGFLCFINMWVNYFLFSFIVSSFFFVMLYLVLYMPFFFVFIGYFLLFNMHWVLYFILDPLFKYNLIYGFLFTYFNVLVFLKIGVFMKKNSFRHFSVDNSSQDVFSSLKKNNFYVWVFSVETLQGVQQMLLDKGDTPPLFVPLTELELVAFCEKALKKHFNIKKYVFKNEEAASFSSEYFLVYKVVLLGVMHLLEGLFLKEVKEDSFFSFETYSGNILEGNLSERTRRKIRHVHLRHILKLGYINCSKGVLLLVHLGSIGSELYFEGRGLNDSSIGDLLHNFYMCQLGWFFSIDG